MSKIKSVLGLLAASLCLGYGGAAQAAYFASTITNGGNTYEDQSREAYFDVNGDGLFGAGDVLAGFVRLDNKTAPNGLALNNQVYGIFTQQVFSVVGTTVFFRPTTTAGLTLADLGIAGAGASDMIAVVSMAGGFSRDLIIQSPGDLTGNGTVTLADYFRFLLTGSTLELIAGMSDGAFCTGGTADCFTASSQFAGGSNASFIGLANSITVANFVAGLEVSLDPAGTTINDSTAAGAFFPPAAIVTTSELALRAGTASGSGGSVNEAEWINGSELFARQCTNAAGANVICGFVDKVDLAFNATRIPEPATLALVGLSLLGMGGAMRRRRG